MASPVSGSQQAQSSGRSPDADLIYQQYLKYYADINDKITAINKLPATQQAVATAHKDIDQLVSLQKQLAPIYTSNYNSSTASLISFQKACASIEAQVVSVYADATGTSATSSTGQNLPSPISIVNSGGSTPSTPPASTGTSTPVVKTSGRSPDATQIYSQYLTYYNDINNKIYAINQLPQNQLSQTKAAQAKTQLLALQSQLYPIYTGQYNNSQATLSSFITACASIESSVSATYNSAITPTATTPPPVAPPVTVPPTVPTTPTTPVAPVTPVSPAPSSLTKIENGTWYVDWTSWNSPVPEGVNAVNIFVGNMHLDSSGKPVIDGFGTFSQNYAQMDTFIQACHAKGISVKMSLGGGGGSYDNCWDVLTSSNVQGFADALGKFCSTHGADGIDFDVEEFTSAQDKPAQQALVGTLIKNFKAINPNYQTSLCTNAGFGPNFPWQGIVQNIFNASLSTDPATGKTTCGVDRLYVMSYFNSLSDEQGWLNGWAAWLKTNYNFSPSQITVGLNSQAKAYDVQAFASWAASKGFSTSYWMYDPANPAQSNAVTNSIASAYKP